MSGENYCSTQGGEQPAEHTTWRVSRTLVVGVGGTGCRAIQHGLKRVQERFGGKRPPFCHFLAIDATGEEAKAPARMERGDFINIGGFNANYYFRRRDDFPYLDWLPTNCLPGEIHAGAQGKPYIGRLCYFMNREGRVMSAVRRKLRELTAEGLHGQVANMRSVDGLELRESADVVIHLVASVCGGTGAGILLDLAFDLRRWCEEETGTNPRVFGHLVLPNAFQLDCSEILRRQHQATGYAILRQVEHFMGANGTTISYKLGAPVTWEKTERPFDFCFLLDGASRTTTTNRESISRNIGRMISLMTAEPSGHVLRDRLENVDLSARAYQRGSDSLATFSSYGIAAAPDGPALAAASGELTTQLLCKISTLKLEGTGRADAKTWRDIVQVFLNPATLEATLQSSISVILKLNERYSGTELARELIKSVDKLEAELGDQAKKAGRDLLEKWQNQGGPAAAIESQIGQLNAGGVDEYLRALAELLDGVGCDVAQGESPKLELPVLTADLDQVARQFKAISEKIKQFAKNVANHATDFYVNQASTTLKKESQSLRTRFRTLRDHCAKFVDGRKRDPLRPGENGQQSGSKHIYEIGPVQMAALLETDGISQDFEALVLRMFKSAFDQREPAGGYAKYLRDQLGSRGDLGKRHYDLLHACVNAFTNLASGDPQAPQAEEIAAGLEKLAAEASPRWLVRADRLSNLDQVNVIVSRHRKPESWSRRLGAQLEQLHDERSPEIVIVRTEHGAALDDLDNQGIYKGACRDAFDARDSLARSQGTRFSQDDLLLDPKWKVDLFNSTVAGGAGVAPNYSTVMFGLLWNENRIVPGDVFVFRDGSAHGVSLGPSPAEAYKCWSSPDLRDMVDAEHAKLKERPLDDLIEAAKQALATLDELAKNPDINGADAAVWREVREHVRRQLWRWQENLKQQLSGEPRPDPPPRPPGQSNDPGANA